MRKLLFLIPLFIFLGCSTKDIEAKNTPLGIHTQIYKAINNGNLDTADNLLLDLEASFPGSIYIKSDLLALFYTHLKYEDFKLAKFYLEQYEKRFASIKEIPWCEYQKIKIEFLSYQNAYTNEAQILNILHQCKTYKLRYPNSNFLPEVNTIYVKALLTKKYLDDKIYRLYKKLGKVEAAKKYKTTLPKNSKPPYVPWYKKIFYW